MLKQRCVYQNNSKQKSSEYFATYNIQVDIKIYLLKEFYYDKVPIFQVH